MLPVDLSNDIVQDKSKLHLIRDESAGKSTIKVRNESESVKFCPTKQAKSQNDSVKMRKDVCMKYDSKDYD